MNTSSEFDTVETLPAHWYHGEEIYHEERARIFARHWALIGPAAELADTGAYVTGAVAGWPVAVMRQADGALKGFHNVCRHRAARVLDNAAGRCERIRCPYHGWAYGLDGMLSAAPGFDVAALRREGCADLWPLEVDTWNGLVFTRLEGGGPDLGSWLGGIADAASGFPAAADMRYFGSRTSSAAVNWKTYSDNSAEGYHLGSVHKGLFAALDNTRTDIRAWPDSECVAFEVEYRSQGGLDHPRGLWIYKFPGLLLHFSEYGFNAERVSPDGPRSCTLTRWFWFPGATPRTVCEQTVAFSTEVMDQDLDICRSVQANLESGRYRTGRVSKSREPGTVLFQHLVRRALAQPAV